MNRKLLIALSATAALAAPLAAQAQSTTASSTITVNGDVEKACVIGEPSLTALNLGDLTGSDGKLTPALLSDAVAASAEIDVAWCNTPSTLSLNGAPMGLTTVPAYPTPAGFTRLLTYNATLSGWPSALVDRPVVGDAAKTTTATSPHAAASLVLDISALDALDAGGTAANTGAILEAGSYSGSVVVSVAVQP